MARYNKELSNQKRRLFRKKVWMYSCLSVTVMMLILGIFQTSTSNKIETIANKDFVFRILSVFIPEKLEFQYGNKLITGKEIVNYSNLYSGGSISTTLSKNAVIEFTFTGEKVSWIGIYDRFQGLVEIYIDNEKVATKDLYSKLTKRNHEIFESQLLTYGEHKIRIQPKENHYSSTEGTSIVVDLFIVNQKDNPIKFENDNPSIKYTHANYYNFYGFIARKLGHLSIYFLITLVLLLLTVKRKKKWEIIIPLIVLLLASLDEYRQKFVAGRHPLLQDVVVDMMGIIIAVVIFHLFKKLFKRPITK